MRSAIEQIVFFGRDVLGQLPGGPETMRRTRRRLAAVLS